MTFGTPLVTFCHIWYGAPWNHFGDFLPNLVALSLVTHWNSLEPSLKPPLELPLQPSLQPPLEPTLEPSGSTFLGTPLGNPQNPLVALSLETLKLSGSTFLGTPLGTLF